MTRQQAINAFCKDCIYDPCEKGTWRQQTEACTSTDCQLYPYRPVARKMASKVTVAALDAQPEGLGDSDDGQ